VALLAGTLARAFSPGWNAGAKVKNKNKKSPMKKNNNPWTFDEGQNPCPINAAPNAAPALGHPRVAHNGGAFENPAAPNNAATRQ
jgi:hypothetical protein